VRVPLGSEQVRVYQYQIPPDRFEQATNIIFIGAFYFLAGFQPAIHPVLDGIGEASIFACGGFVHNLSIVGLTFIWFDLV
jgi:hypothetical protein